MKSKEIVVEVRTSWQGQIAINEKYVIKAKKEKKDIAIKHNFKKFVIPFDKIEQFKSAHQPKQYIDKFTFKPYTLYHFPIPTIDNNQLGLFTI